MPPESLKSKTERLPDKGIYLLLIYLPNNKNLRVGALGIKNFKAGYYVYVGSAQRNLRKRVKRHLSRKKRIRWHIDYLLSIASVEDILAYSWGKDGEEGIAKALMKKYAYVDGFGASDTRARSHLFYLENLENWREIEAFCKELNKSKTF